MTTKLLEQTMNQRYNFSSDVDYMENYFAIFNDIDDSPEARSPHKMDGLMFVGCLSGCIEIMLDLKKYTLHANDILIVLPGQIVQLESKSKDFDGRFLFMSSEFMANISLRKRNFSAFFVIRDNPKIRFSKEDIDKYAAYHDFIRSRMRSSNYTYRLDIIQHLVGALFFEFISMETYMADKKAKLNRKDEICSEFLNLLIRHYKESRSVSFFADKLFITPKYLSATLRAVTGKKAGQLIDDYVLLQAKVMLKSTNMTVQQISEELSFANQSFFARYFKHLSGVTPTQYRNQ